LHLYENGNNVAAAAREVRAARSSVHKWRSLYEAYGEEGLKPQRRGREPWKTDESALSELAGLLEREPGDFGYLRSRWSSELLARVLCTESGIAVHATTVRRWLRELDYRWRRARPTLHKRDPRKLQRIRAIERALRDKRRGTEVFYVDEVDIDLNPKIGYGWRLRGQQSAVPTPGQNRKRYLAGALHAHSGRVVFSEGERKNSDLFLKLLELLRRTWRAARRIVLILDNYRIHSSRITRAWLAANRKFELLFQPAYHPWVNAIERLWKQLHETVTRNHRHATMPALMKTVRRFMAICQPFPGNQHGLATA
jgi:transposase|tara:strand:+ start:210 stop:1142 length:933 start_codon:yes stop_codon:yes gene_type:complete